VNSAPGLLRALGGVIAFVAALAILYLAFRGPLNHPQASTPAATSSPYSPYTPGTTGGQGVGQGAGAQPATIAPTAPAPTVTPATSATSATSATPTVTVTPTAPATTAAPAASPTASTSQAAGPLAAAQAYLAGRHGRVEVAVYDLASGQQWTLGQQAPQAEASVVKLEILEAVLHNRSAQRVVLSLTEQELTPPMIEQSDNAAATTLWGDVGGAKGMRAFDHKAGLVHTSPSNCVRCPGFPWPGWGLTTTTPQDQVTLLRQLVQPSGILDENDQKYALRLLENVTPSQRWGIAGGVPAGVKVALKDGWLPLGKGSTDWQVNSVGWVSGDGRNYLVAVMSAGNPSEQYGIDTLNHLGAMVWSALAPRH
jgi:beta-lactamase class A